MIFVASVFLGLMMAVVYHYAFLRAQARLARRSGELEGIAFVGGFMLRLTAAGAALLAVYHYTPLNVAATAVGFVAGFVGLHGRDLYLYAVGRGPLSGGRGSRPDNEDRND